MSPTSTNPQSNIRNNNQQTPPMHFLPHRPPPYLGFHDPSIQLNPVPTGPPHGGAHPHIPRLTSAIAKPHLAPLTPRSPHRTTDSQSKRTQTNKERRPSARPGSHGHTDPLPMFLRECTRTRRGRPRPGKGVRARGEGKEGRAS